MGAGRGGSRRLNVAQNCKHNRKVARPHFFDRHGGIRKDPNSIHSFNVEQKGKRTTKGRPVIKNEIGTGSLQGFRKEVAGVFLFEKKSGVRDNT